MVHVGPCCADIYFRFRRSPSSKPPSLPPPTPRIHPLLVHTRVTPGPLISGSSQMLILKALAGLSLCPSLQQDLKSLVSRGSGKASLARDDGGLRAETTVTMHRIQLPSQLVCPGSGGAKVTAVKKWSQFSNSR